MAPVHTIQNGLPSHLAGNNVSREQPQSIENSKEFNQTTTDAIHEPSTFSDRVNFSFLDFSDPINTPFWEPYTFSDPIVITSWDPSAFSYPTHTTFLESLANSSSSVLHSWFFLYSRKEQKIKPRQKNNSVRNVCWLSNVQMASWDCGASFGNSYRANISRARFIVEWGRPRAWYPFDETNAMYLNTSWTPYYRNPDQTFLNQLHAF